MESNEEDTLTQVKQIRKFHAEETTLIVKGCIKESIEEHEMKGISYS